MKETSPSGGVYNCNFPALYYEQALIFMVIEDNLLSYLLSNNFRKCWITSWTDGALFQGTDV